MTEINQVIHEVAPMTEPDDGIDRCLCGAEWPCRFSAQGRRVIHLFGEHALP